MPSRVNVAIIGGGIVGLATGLEILGRFPGVSLAVLEKEPKVAAHQTSHNSGVIHSGIYYKPGSLKASLCTEGVSALLRFCDEHAIPYNICGKVIVATSQDEGVRLDEVYRRGMANGLNGLRMLTGDEIRELEPHAAGIRGIHVPGTGIVDYSTVARKYADLIQRGGGTIHLSHEVVALRPYGKDTVIETTRGAIDRASERHACRGLLMVRGTYRYQVYRLYKEEGLALKKRPQHKRKAVRHWEERFVATAPNQACDRSPCQRIASSIDKRSAR